MRSRDGRGCDGTAKAALYLSQIMYFIQIVHSLICGKITEELPYFLLN